MTFSDREPAGGWKEVDQPKTKSRFVVGVKYTRPSERSAIIYTCTAVTSQGNAILEYTLDFTTEKLVFDSDFRNYSIYIPPRKGQYWILVTMDLLDEPSVEPKTEVFTTLQAYETAWNAARYATNKVILHDPGKVEWTEPSNIK